MKLFYAYGSGLGHLNRIHRYMQWRKFDLAHTIVITNSKYKDYLPQEIIVQHYSDDFFKEKEHFFKAVEDCIETYVVTELIVDVFPSGFYGELQVLDRVSIPKTLLTRILNPSYFETYTSPHYETLVVLEKGIALEYYKYTVITHLQINTLAYSNREIKVTISFFVIIHSGPEDEVLQLYKFAKLYQNNKEQIYIQTFSTGLKLDKEDVTLIFSEQPLKILLEKAVKIFTACGFNLFWGTQAYRQKQHFLPFKRRYDDQFKRKRINR